MKIMTAKVSRGKLALIALLLAAAVLVPVFLLKSAKKESPAAAESAQQSAPAEIRTNEDRIAFLLGFGWEVKPDPVQSQEVRIPSEPSDVFDRYNQLQLSQGYDLSKYAGRDVQRYVYEITNYPGDSESHCATLLVCDGTVIGGDVSSQAQGGVMHGLQMPSSSRD